MTEGPKPLKPAKITDFAALNFDNLVWSPKIDGIRARVFDGIVRSNTFKPIPNKYVQHMFGKTKYNGLDGELIVGHMTADDVYHRTYSGVMSAVGEPDVVFHTFDRTDMPLVTYRDRHSNLVTDERVDIVPHIWLRNVDHLLEYEEGLLEQGYEGVMGRAYTGPKSCYKFGRSTEREQTLLRLKRFHDGEAVILDFKEEMKNNNEQIANGVGTLKRSTHKENLVGKGALGAFIVRELVTGEVFSVGGGISRANRELYWRMREGLRGMIITYKSFRIGVKDAPRFGTWKGFRDPMDIEGMA